MDNQTKVCSDCGFEKPLSEFPTQRRKYKDGPSKQVSRRKHTPYVLKYCRDCYKDRLRRWRGNNPDQPGRSAEHFKAVRDLVVVAYGGRCSLCGESEREFLNLDHVNGGGNAHRKSEGPYAHYLDARDRGFPEDYRVLCFNCNLSLGRTRKESPKSEATYWYRKLKDDVIAAYGNKCRCCGQTARDTLSLDHRHGGGSHHRKTGGSNAHYVDAKRRGFPDDYQVLCYNCNCFVGNRGPGTVCPHQRKALDNQLRSVLP